MAPATWGAGFHTPLASRSPWPHPLPAIKYAPAHPLAVRHLPALSTLSYVQTLNVYALLSPIGTPHAHLSSAQTHLPFFLKVSLQHSRLVICARHCQHFACTAPKHVSQTRPLNRPRGLVGVLLMPLQHKRLALVWAPHGLRHTAVWGALLSGPPPSSKGMLWFQGCSMARPTCDALPPHLVWLPLCVGLTSTNTPCILLCISPHLRIPVKESNKIPVMKYDMEYIMKPNRKYDWNL